MVVGSIRQHWQNSSSVRSLRGFEFWVFSCLDLNYSKTQACDLCDWKNKTKQHVFTAREQDRYWFRGQHIGSPLKCFFFILYLRFLRRSVCCVLNCWMQMRLGFQKGTWAIFYTRLRVCVRTRIVLGRSNSHPRVRGPQYRHTCSIVNSSRGHMTGRERLLERGQELLLHWFSAKVFLECLGVVDPAVLRNEHDLEHTRDNTKTLK